MNLTREITLPSDPAEAIQALKAASNDTDVVVFKKSPTCPISLRAEFEFKKWLKEIPESESTRYVVVDVLSEKPLARGLTTELGIEHESPQALWFSSGDLAWHDSHGALTVSRFAAGAGA